MRSRLRTRKAEVRAYSSIARSLIQYDRYCVERESYGFRGARLASDAAAGFSAGGASELASVAKSLPMGRARIRLLVICGRRAKGDAARNGAAKGAGLEEMERERNCCTGGLGAARRAHTAADGAAQRTTGMAQGARRMAAGKINVSLKTGQVSLRSRARAAWHTLTKACCHTSGRLRTSTRAGESPRLKS